MAASARDLLDSVSRHVVLLEPDEATAVSASHATGQLARVLVEFVRHDPSLDDRLTRRHHVVADALASEAARVGQLWPPASSRLSDLAGAAADAVVLELPHHSQDERWAAVVETAHAIGSCVAFARGFSPLSKVAELERTQRLTQVVHRIAVHEATPELDHAVWLDLPVAARAPVETGSRDAVERVVDAAADLVRIMTAHNRSGAVAVRHLLVAAATAEAFCRDTARIADAAPEVVDTARATADSWRVVQAALVRLDDGNHRASEISPRLFEDAATVTRQFAQITSDVGGPVADAGDGAERARAIRAAQYVANHLPELARVSTDAVTSTVDRGLVLARARAMPPGTQPVDAIAEDRVVVVQPDHIAPILLATRRAERLSVALAVQLDRAYPHSQPQRELARARAHEFRPRHVEIDADWSRRIAARIDTLVPAARTSMA